ncbi:MAG: helix-turn-helix transcriptional regulator [Rhodoferax sp.]|nr:helix-turn-helix transcriptional regulator [Rhodoferax sp.]
MNVILKTYRFDWLVSSNEDPLVFTPNIDTARWHAFPIPPELGHGGVWAVELAQGISLARGEHHLTPAAVGQLIPLAKVTMDFPEKTLSIEVLRGGRFLQRSVYPPGEFLAGPGLDIFRMTDRIEMTPIIDGAHDVIGSSLLMTWSALCHLIGEGVAQELQSNLGLDDWPKALIKPIPLHVSAHLMNALPKNLNGPIRTLHTQARVLDYFDALIGVVGTQPGEMADISIHSERDRAHALYAMLVQSEGKIPTLDELGRQFSCSTRRLNDEFVSEFGKSIYTFISHHRLEEAHAAIQGTEIPMKKLAQRLGYAHFNHFSAAFKKKFGYPPGSLRR